MVPLCAARRTLRSAVMKILMVLTSHGQLGNTGKPTGLWLEELATPYYVFTNAGAEVTLASPRPPTTTGSPARGGGPSASTIS